MNVVSENWKAQVLPLARIKKIMKSEEVIYLEEEKERTNGADSEVVPQRFMIKGEAPVLMGKACELLIRDLTIRSWRHTERNRRRTLQRIDVQAAVGEDEVFDYLIDIVPRLPEGVISKPSSDSDYQTDEYVPMAVPVTMQGGMTSPITNESSSTNGNGNGNGNGDGDVATPAINIPLAAQSDAELRLAQLAQMHEFMMIQQQMQTEAVTNLNTGLHNHTVNLQMPIHVPVNPAYFVRRQVHTQRQWTAPTMQNTQDAQQEHQDRNEQKEDNNLRQI